MTFAKIVDFARLFVLRGTPICRPHTKGCRALGLDALICVGCPHTQVGMAQALSRGWAFSSFCILLSFAHTSDHNGTTIKPESQTENVWKVRRGISGLQRLKRRYFYPSFI